MWWRRDLRHQLKEGGALLSQAQTCLGRGAAAEAVPVLTRAHSVYQETRRTALAFVRMNEGLPVAVVGVHVSRMYMGYYRTRPAEAVKHLGEAYSQEMETGSTLARIHIDLKRFRDALDCLESALNAAREMQDRASEAMALASMALLHDVHLDQPEEAIRLYEEALSAAHKGAGLSAQRAVLQGLAAVYKRLGRDEESRKCLEEVSGLGSERND